MIKASALSLATKSEEYATGISWLIRNNQNMIIESVKNEEEIPEPVAELALRMLKYDSVLKDIVNDLRMLYVSKREDFHLSLVGKSREEKDVIINLFQDLYGIVSVLHYTSANEILNGKLVFSPKAQMFITGQYLEIAVYRQVVDIMSKLSRQYSRPYKVYRNVRVATCEGRLKNEFDIVIDFDGIFYVIEIKSGKNFREFDKYMYIGREYQIVPDRFLLIDNYLSNEHAKTIEYFCDYYVSNLTGNSLEMKLIQMVENDLRGGK